MHTSTHSSSVHKRYRGSVLIVEDNPDNWLVMQAALRNHLPEVQTTWVTGAAGALDYLALCLTDNQPLPHVILLDLYLPNREEAWQLLKSLKANPRYHNTPVVVISYSSNPDDVRQTYQCGCTSYIVKPTEYAQWLDYFQTFKSYWWDAVTVPRRNWYD